MKLSNKQLQLLQSKTTHLGLKMIDILSVKNNVCENQLIKNFLIEDSNTFLTFSRFS